MTEYFAGFEVVARTPNFILTCEDDVGARLRAQCISNTCEEDLARLNDLFSTNFQAGKTSPNTIWVVVLKDDPTAEENGWNYGYETDNSSRIGIARAFTPPPPSPPLLFQPDPLPLPGPDLNSAIMEFPRFVFVAELAEILMQFTGYGWNPGQSPGEGLSNVLGSLLHPIGYYDTGQGPRINEWLNGVWLDAKDGPQYIPLRTDFISRTVDTDKDKFSYGCAIVFIYYLVDQLGYSLKDVIRAGGSTLAETYARLTGQPASAAYANFNALLQAHIGGATRNNMGRDNIFPLLEVNRRTIQMTADSSRDMGHVTDPTPVSFEVSPGGFCHKGMFDFWRHREKVEVPVFARAYGMANAAFRWMIEGVEVSVRNNWTTLTMDTPLTVKNPDGHPDEISTSVTFQYGILDIWNGSVLYLKTLDWKGNCTLKVTVAAREAAITEPEVTAEESVDLTTVTWIPGDDFKKASARCNPFFAEMNHSFWYLTQKLSDIKNRPDPPSERTAQEMIQAVEQVQKAVGLFASAAHQSPTEILQQLGTPDGLQSPYPVAPPVDMTRLRLRDGRQGQVSEEKEA
jgi:hypothetical protein